MRPLCPVTASTAKNAMTMDILLNVKKIKDTKPKQLRTKLTQD